MLYGLRSLTSLLVLLLAGLLASCGGGGGDDTADGGVGSGGTGASVGVVQVAVTDAPAPQFDNVWVTINEVRIHTSSTAGPDDAGWLDYPLPNPVTLDLAALNNGASASLFSNLSVPVGSYQQIRLVLAGNSDPLTGSAQLEKLSYNDQVNYTDSSGSHSVPLEIASPAQGISVTGSFTVSTSSTLSLMFDFDIGDDVVKYSRGGTTGYTLKPLLKYFDLAHVGAVTGQIDTSSLNASGAYDLVIKAEDGNPSGALHTVLRGTSVTSTGAFTLFPVPVPVNKTSTTVDILISGRGMDTMIIKGVPVTQGSTPTNNATVVSQAAISITASNEYTMNLNPGTLTPTGAWVELYQTLPGSGEVPYEVQFQHADPYSDAFVDNLPVASGSLLYGSYSSGGSPSFTSTAPVEGAGSFAVYGMAPSFQSTEATGMLAPPASGSGPVDVTIPALQLASGFTADSVSGSITQKAGEYDSGYLVLTRNGLIATTLNLSSVLAQGSGAGGAYTVSNLAGGSASTTQPGYDYYGYVVVWNSAHPAQTMNVQSLSGYANLSAGNATGFTISLQ